jgi:glycosyltransferase EpsJ
MPELSVIVPVYKAEAFLRRCTDSILGQNFPDLELLLIEDGSPDGSGALCDAIAAEDKRVRVFHKENGGVSSARNLGMEEAQGRFLAFADADDWFAPKALEILVNAAVESGADTAGSAHYKAYPSGQVEMEAAALPSGVYDAEAIKEGIVYRLLGDRLGKQEELLNGFIWRFLFTREIIQKNEIRFLGAYLEDELFLLEYFCHAQKLAIVEEPLYYYLQNPQSVTRNYLPDYMETFARVMNAKEALAKRFELDAARPHWRENSNWSGLLIAVGNEYAPGNPATFWEKRRRVMAMTQLPSMQKAMQTIHPKGLSRNKQMVADLLSRRMFTLLTALYAVKNRNR